MAQVAGLTTLEKTASGRATIIRLDVRKFENNTHLKNFFNEVGFELEKPIKWTAKMKRSFAQADNGEWSVVDPNNFWGE